MEIKVKVKTGMPKTEIVKKEGDTFMVNLKSLPKKGKANNELINLFSKRFKKEVKIVKGFKSKRKVLKLL